MGRRIHRRMLLVAGAVSVALAACAAILGVDDVRYHEADPSDGATPEAAEATHAVEAADAHSPESGDAVAPGAYALAVMADKPIAYWRLSDTTAAACRNEVSDRYTAQYLGDVTLGQPGIFGNEGDKAVHFGEGSVLQVAAAMGAAPLDFPNHVPFSFELWIELDDRPDAAIAALFKDMIYPTAPTLGHWLLVGADKGIFWQRWARSASFPSGVWAGAKGGMLTSAHFTHVVVTSDGVATVLYFDGMPNTGYINQPDANTPANGSTFQWGAINGGALDELAIYDYKLGGDRVGAHFNAVNPR